MTGTSSLLEPSTGAPVQFLWGSNVLVHDLDLTGIVKAGAALPTDGPPRENLDPASVLADPAALNAVLLAAINTLAAADGAPLGSAVDVTVQGWREGHGVPAAAAGTARYVAWCYLAATPPPATAESGCLSLADPRAGSDLTAMPGLPWGRQVIIRPVPGALTVAPGWLIHSVVPVQHDQRVIVAVATCSR